MKKQFTLLVLVFISVTSFAQVSRYLDQDQSGLGLRLGTAATYGTQSLYAQFGGSIKGRIDIEGSYTRNKFDAGRLDLLEGNATADDYEGWINYWLFRKSIHPAIDVNLGVWAEYAYSVYQNFLAADPETYKYIGYNEGQFGFEMATNFRVTDTWWIQPALFAYYAVGKEKWEENAETVSNNYHGVGSSIQLGVVKRIKKNSLYLQYNHYFDSYEGSSNAYMFSAGFILGL
jgi:hypothetical protein